MYWYCCFCHQLLTLQPLHVLLVAATIQMAAHKFLKVSVSSLFLLHLKHTLTSKLIIIIRDIKIKFHHQVSSQVFFFSNTLITRLHFLRLGNPTNSGPMGGNGNGGGLEELEELEEEEEVVLEYTEEFTAGPATTSLRPLPILINGTYLCSTTCPEWAIKKSSPTGTAVCTCGSLSKPLILYR